MPEKTCKDCKHWHRVEGGVIVGETKPGFCRGGPPQVVLFPTGMQCHYPLVLPSNPICGLFEEAQKVEPGSF